MSWFRVERAIEGRVRDTCGVVNERTSGRQVTGEMNSERSFRFKTFGPSPKRVAARASRGYFIDAQRLAAYQRTINLCGKHVTYDRPA